MTAPIKLMMATAGVSTAAGNPGPLFSWGEASSYGQTGQGDAINLSSPVQVGSLETWTQVAGFNARFGVRSDGKLFSWGSGAFGLTGHGDVITRSSPTQVGSLTDWGGGELQVDADYYNAVFVKSDGTLWGTGQNSRGQLGDETVIERSSPVQVGSLTTWSKVTTHNGNVHAIKTDGTLWAWGYNNDGQLGVGTVINLSSPVQIGTDTTWTDISTGQGNTMGISNGILYAWGENKYGRLGFDGSTAGIDALGVDDKISSPIQMGTLTDWSKIKCTGDSTMGVTDSGKLFGWGTGHNGRLGVGDVIDHSSPTQVGSLTDWINVSAGSALAGSIKANGTLWMWGRGTEGEMGQGAVINRSSPIQVGSEEDWSGINPEKQSVLGIRGG
jgi:alpha-tubulin suppressor-like RCC1 family protein